MATGVQKQAGAQHPSCSGAKIGAATQTCPVPLSPSPARCPCPQGGGFVVFHPPGDALILAPCFSLLLAAPKHIQKRKKKRKKNKKTTDTKHSKC